MLDGTATVERRPSASAQEFRATLAETIRMEMGLGDEEVARRKETLGLTTQDVERILALQPYLQGKADENTTAFLDHLSRSPSSRTLFGDPGLLAKVRAMKERHLTTMVEGNYGREYVLQRLELAQLYSEARLDVKSILSAFHYLMVRVGDQIMTYCAGDAMRAMEATGSVRKVLFFDLALMAEVLIFQREKAIERLATQASQYARSLIEASLDPLVTIGTDGKITDVNDASVLATGVPRERLIGTDFSNYFTQPEKARAGYQEVFSKGLVRDYPLTIRHTSGKLIDVLYNATVYKDAGGKVLGVFAAARDVTAQKQASQYARSLIEASLDPLVTIGPDGKITDVNDASMRATGMPREKLIGTDFSNYFTEPEKARAGYQEVFKKGFVTDYPLTIRHASGKLTDVLYNATVYKDTTGKVLGVFAAARDVTGQKKAESEVAEQRARELSRLAELERFQRLTVGRELKMIELKREIEELRTRAGTTL